jgi:hypothetical protein
MTSKHSKVTEQHVQAIMMKFILEKMRHEVVIPNVERLLPHEADMVSYTRNQLLHEFEIKLDKYDFQEDRHKPKHATIPTAKENSPAYFWYVTYNFSIQPPAHAGWILIKNTGEVQVMKEAPKHNEWKMEADKFRYAALTLSKRVARMYMAYYLNQDP